MNIIKYIKFALYILSTFINLSDLKNNNIVKFRETISKNNGIDLIDIDDVVDLNSVEIIINNLETKPGYVSILELVILSAIISRTDEKQNILEIGTFDGKTTINLARNTKNIVYTLDLPLDMNENLFNYNDFDKNLIKNRDSSKNELNNFNNIKSIYCDSTKFDFSSIDYSVAFIDGGHDYKTVKSDTKNIIETIKKPGIILWHDYDVTNDVGKCLIDFANTIKINWIRNTRMCISKVS